MSDQNSEQSISRIVRGLVENHTQEHLRAIIDGLAEAIDHANDEAWSASRSAIFSILDALRLDPAGLHTFDGRHEAIVFRDLGERVLKLTFSSDKYSGYNVRVRAEVLKTRNHVAPIIVVMSQTFKAGDAEALKRTLIDDVLAEINVGLQRKLEIRGEALAELRRVFDVS